MNHKDFQEKYQQPLICRWYQSNDRKWRGAKEPLDECERGLRNNIKKIKILASSPISSWQIDEEKVETVIDYIFLGSKITAEGDCSHEIKRCLLLGRKAMANLDSVLKSRDITLLTNVQIVKAMVFPVVRYRCEGWTIKQAECWRIAALNCGTGEESWESLGQQGDQASQS